MSSDLHHHRRRELLRELSARRESSGLLEEECRVLFELSCIATAHLDPATGAFARVNERLCELTLYSAADLLAKTFTELAGPESERADLAWMSQIARGEIRVHRAFDRQLLRRDGRTLYVNLEAAPVRDVNGRVVRIVLAIQDVTDDRRAVGLLVGQRQVLEMLAQGAPLERVLDGLVHVVERHSDGMKCSVLLLDEDGKRLRYGSAPSLPPAMNLAIDGLPIGPSVGSCGTAAHRREQVIVSDTLTDPLWADYRSLAIEHSLRACWSTPIRSRDGSVLGTFAMYYGEVRLPTREEAQLIESTTALAAVAIESTQTRLRNQALLGEVQLSEANQFLATLVDNIPHMIFVKSADELRFVRLNKASEGLLGQAREELIGKSDHDLFPRSEADFFTSKDRAVLASGVVLDIPEEPIHTRFMGERILHTKKIPLYDAEGRARYLLGISEDITERKQAEADRTRLVRERESRIEAERSVQLRDNFLSIAAHELRTPLTPIRMHLQLVKRHIEAFAPEVPNADKLLKSLVKADRQFDRFLRLVENLLDVSRITAGRLVLEREELDLSELVHEVVDSFEVEVANAGCALHIHAERGVRGLWDRLRIEQVLSNLLTNAFKYGAGKEIDVRASAGPETATLEVRDRGIGIQLQFQSKIFGPFERVASLRNYGGLGLGLYITHEIVAAHAGTIRVESEEGEGAAFIVELPLR